MTRRLVRCGGVARLAIAAALAVVVIATPSLRRLAPSVHADLAAADTRQPVSMLRLSDRVRVLSGGIQHANVTAIRTSAGIVLIDSGESIEVGREIRHVLAREFPGAVVTHIVNTHAHWDHVLGNAAFPEATIVAHESCLTAMVRLQEPVGAGETREARQPGAAPPPPRPGIPPPPPPTPLEVHLTPDVYALTVPDVTFADQHVVRSGGVTLNLVYYGPAHTRSDVLVLVPEEGLLFVGDLYYRKTLPSFSQTVTPEVEAWRRALDRVLAAPARFDRVVSGHGEVIPRAEFEAQVRYLFEVWERAGEAVRAGRSLDSLQQDLTMERAFPALSALDVRSSHGESLHEGNVRNAWRHRGGRAKTGAEPAGGAQAGVA